MTRQMKHVRGSVRLLFCDKCGADFPIFDYEVESDTETIGLYSAGTCDGENLLLIDLSLEEWRAAQDGSLKELPSRYAQAIEGDYRLTHILRVEQATIPPAGNSFADFKRHYRAPKVVYLCPCCGEGESVTKSEILASDYMKAGGKIIATDPLVLEISATTRN